MGGGCARTAARSGRKLGRRRFIARFDDVATTGAAVPKLRILVAEDETSLRDVLVLQIKHRLASDPPFAMLQADIDNFKAFNAHYGCPRGDLAIQALARILVEEGLRHEGSTFVGHIGGDDFVLLTEPLLAEKLGHSIIKAFDRVVPPLYDPEDI